VTVLDFGSLPWGRLFLFICDAFQTALNIPKLVQYSSWTRHCQTHSILAKMKWIHGSLKTPGTMRTRT
jgi:hypothetical protein